MVVLMEFRISPAPGKEDPTGDVFSPLNSDRIKPTRVSLRIRITPPRNSLFIPFLCTGVFLSEGDGSKVPQPILSSQQLCWPPPGRTTSNAIILRISLRILLRICIWCSRTKISAKCMRATTLKLQYQLRLAGNTTTSVFSSDLLVIGIPAQQVARTEGSLTPCMQEISGIFFVGFRVLG